MMKTIYTVTGMTCGGCVSRVKSALAPLAQSVEVTLDPPKVVLENSSVDLIALNVALNKAGHYQLHANRESLLPLTEPEEYKPEESTKQKNWFSVYKPLILVFAYILLVTLAVEYRLGSFELHRFMPNFMAGFFLVFSFFKLLDIKGFANSYAMYDLLAKRLPSYGLLYPFIELSLGCAYLFDVHPTLTNIVTLIVMGFSSIGVLIAVMNKQKIRCACLGTGFNLPMTTVTIIEDVLMAAMAAWMLI